MHGNITMYEVQYRNQHHLMYHYSINLFVKLKIKISLHSLQVSPLPSLLLTVSSIQGMNPGMITVKIHPE